MCCRCWGRRDCVYVCVCVCVHAMHAGERYEHRVDGDGVEEKGVTGCFWL